MEQNGANIERETINEFDALKDLNERLLSEDLDISTYSTEEQNYILNYRENLSTKIEGLKNESYEVLKIYNYSDAQIDAIRNFDGSDAMLRIAASKCTVYGGFTDFSHSSSGSSARMIAAFEWNGAYNPGNPIATKDIFGVTWSAPFTEKSATGHLSHKNANYNSTIQSTVSVTPDDLYISSIQVPNNKLKSVSGADQIGHWIDAGSIISQISTKTNTPEIAGYASYGLNTIIFSPSIDVSKSGVGGSLAFSSGITKAGGSRFYSD